VTPPDADETSFRLTVRVQPGASRAKVGGRYGDGEPPVLVVKVTARAIDGRANEAVREALAGAFGLRVNAVTLKSGGSSRLKVFALAGADPARLDELLGG
jgi:uncharacterized protein YggU (UPF0235/DUF167 family)